VDPNLFHLDWEQVAEVLVAIVVLAFIVERALALLFEWRPFVGARFSPYVKEPIALLVSLAICSYWKLDALSVLLRGEQPRALGMLMTAAVIAGGSKAAVKLFRDVLGVESGSAKRARTERTDPAPKKPVAPAPG
jgi:hypothetical protein